MKTSVEPIKIRLKNISVVLNMDMFKNRGKYKTNPVKSTGT